MKACLAVCFAVLTATPATAATRQVTPLMSDWKFVRQDVPQAKDAAFDAAAWQSVSLPHTYNAADAAAGGDKNRGDDEGVYYRGPAWYRHALDITPKPGTRYVLQFDGAALVTDVYVNGKSVGHHEGGYAGFRFDITDALKAGGNVVAVRVDNAHVPQVAPLTGDFNVFGGLYRGVSLIAAPAVHLDLADHGGPGVYVTTTSIGPKAQLSVKALLKNDSSASTAAKVTVRLVDAAGKTVAQGTASKTLASGQGGTADFNLTVAKPHLWDGRGKGYLYRVITDVSSGGDTDSLGVPFGIRTVGFVDGRFQLNGKPYAIYGANMQQPGRYGKGTAVSNADIDEDMKILDDMGVTALRLAHMQHPQRVYDDADQMGLLLTTEVPLVDEMTETPAFRDNVVEQMRELVAQNYNHPSVALWGIGNEIRRGTPAFNNEVLAALQSTAKGMDAHRPTVYAHCCLADDDAIAKHSDVISYNRYFGWYGDTFADMGKWADALHAKLPGSIIGVSEYGAGASIKHQEDLPKVPNPQGYWHPEQYQALYHEGNWKELKARPWIWSDFIWVAFDFPSFRRNEGDRPAINDKGLVTEDRATKKDAYYWYQANWTDRPMLHINSARDNPKRTRTTTVKIYSNLPEVRLQLNGKDLGAQKVDNHIATWRISLQNGDNVVEASGGKDLKETVHWSYSDQVK
jgi:beta-galactosidase